jgi:hypothetical protein
MYYHYSRECTVWMGMLITSDKRRRGEEEKRGRGGS